MRKNGAAPADPPAKMLLNFKKLKVGHKLLGVIKQVNDFELVISLPSHLTGFVSYENISQRFASKLEAATSDDVSEENKILEVLGGVYKEGQIVICVISEVQQKPKKRLQLSLLPNEVNAGLDLTSEAIHGTMLAAEIVGVEDRGYQVSFGSKSGEIVGFLPASEASEAFSLGQTIPVWVKSSKNRLFQVSAKMESSALLKEPSVNALRPGSLVSGEITGTGKDGNHFLKIKFGGDSFEGRMDLFQLPGDIGFKRAKELDLEEHFKLGQKIKGRLVWCDHEEKRFLLTGTEEIVPSRPQDLISFGETVEECQVLRVDAQHGILMEVPGSMIPAYIHISQLTDDHLEKISGSEWKVGSKHTCRIIDYDPFDGLLIASAKPSSLKEAFVRVDEIQPGQLVRGTISRVESYGVLVQLTEHIRAICPNAHLTETQSSEAAKKCAPGSKYRFRVIDVDPKTRRITLSRKAGLVASELPSLTSLADAKIGAYHDGFIVAVRDFGLLVRFYAGLKGLIPVAEISDDYVERPQAAFFVGQVVRCRVSKCCPEKGELNLSLRKTIGPKAKPEGSEKDKKSTVKAEKKEKKGEITENTVSMDSPVLVSSAEKRAADEDSSSASELEESKLVLEPKRTKKEKAQVAKTTEMTLDDLVEADSNVTTFVSDATSTKKQSMAVPTGPSLREICDEFEKRLIGQPNSSYLWIQYMSALLRASEPDSARQVAERALTTIRFRDVQEKLNVWIAYMNLERAAGTPETLRKVFERACVYNEPKHVHIQLAKIYEETRDSSSDSDEALELHKLMCKKFSQSCKVWVGHLVYLYAVLKDVTGARKLLPQSLKSLPKRKHVKITLKVAQLEYKYGSHERARTIFEGVLSNAPKRVDIWSVYLTMEENRLTATTANSDEQGNADFVRRLFERIVHLRMSSKKAKFFFKRFLDFEKAHGSEAGVEHVKELARAYVESNMSSSQ